MEDAVADDIDDDDDTEIDPTGGAGSGGKAGGRRQAADPTAIDPDEDVDDDPDGDGDTGDEPGADAKDKPAKGKAAYTPPDEDAWLKVTSQADKEAKLRKAREGTIRELKAELKAAKEANASDDEKAQAKATAAIESKLKPVAVRASARAAFMEAGLTDLSKERMTALMRLVDLDDIEIDDDGSVIGLDEQVDSIKELWPQLFITPEAAKEPERRRPAPKATVADKSRQQPKTTQTMGERIASRHNAT
jgi:hypothetical protein